MPDDVREMVEEYEARFGCRIGLGYDTAFDYDGLRDILEWCLSQDREFDAWEYHDAPPGAVF